MVVKAGKEFRRIRVPVHEADVREEESGRDVDGATRVENFGGMVLLPDELEQGATLETKLGVQLFIFLNRCPAIVHLDRAYSQLLVSGSGVPEGEEEGQVPTWNSET